MVHAATLDDVAVSRLLAATFAQAVQDAHHHDAGALSFLLDDGTYRLWQFLANRYIPIWTYRLGLYEQTRPYKPHPMKAIIQYGGKKRRKRRERHE
ncbi:MAG: hypothetical protein QME21_07115 [Anaerolineales bacterium]|nr:hypothetical protein [Anaerolineales bacterium]